MTEFKSDPKTKSRSIFFIIEKSYKYLIWIYLVALLLIHFRRIFDNCFWADEIFSIEAAKGNFANSVYVSSHDNHPPFYYLLLNLVTKLLGDKSWVYHFSSFLAYALLLIECVTLIRKKIGTATAFIVMTLSSFLYSSMTYIVEVRMYEWGAFFVLSAAVFLCLIMRDNQKIWYILYLIATVLGAYTHYYCFLTIIYLYIGLIIWGIVKKGEILKRVIIISCSAILLYAPWFVTLFKTLSNNKETSWMTGYPRILDCLKYLFDGKAWLLLWMCFLGGMIFYFIRNKMNGDSVFIIIAFLSVTCTVFTGILVSIIDHPVLLTRYLYPCSTICWLILGLLIQNIFAENYVYDDLLGVAISLIIGAWFFPYYLYVYDSEKAQDAAMQQTVDEVNAIRDDETVFVVAGDQCPGLCRYYFDLDETITLNGMTDKTKNYVLFVDENEDTELKEYVEQNDMISVLSNMYMGTARYSIYKYEP